jgi:hypothetical protein
MRTEDEKRKERREDRIWYAIILICLLYFFGRMLVGCTPTSCLTEEARFHQKHWYDQEHCRKRSKTELWLVESRANEGIVIRKGKVLSK